MHDTLSKTDAKRPAIILALCVATLIGLAVMASTGTGSAAPKKTTTTQVPNEDEPGFNCAKVNKHSDGVCGALHNGQPATGKDLADAYAAARDAADRLETHAQTCALTGPRYWGKDNTVPYGFKVTCETRQKPAAPVKATPRITG